MYISLVIYKLISISIFNWGKFFHLCWLWWRVGSNHYEMVIYMVADPAYLYFTAVICSVLLCKKVIYVLLFLLILVINPKCRILYQAPLTYVWYGAFFKNIIPYVFLPPNFLFFSKHSVKDLRRKTSTSSDILKVYYLWLFAVNLWEVSGT